MFDRSARPLPSRRRLLIMLGALSAFGPLSFDMYLPGLPQLTSDLGASETGGQLSPSVSMVGLGLGQIVVGPLSDQLGRRRPLLIGVSLFTVAAVACALTPNLEFLLLARFLGGLGGGAGAVIARSMVRDLYSGRDAARAFGITALVFGVAPVVAPLLGALLMAVTGWRGIFGAIALCGVALLVAALRLPETLPPQDRHDSGITSLFSEFPRVLRDRTFLAPALVLAIGFQPLSLYLAMSSFALQEGYGLSAQQFGYLFAANSVGILLLGRLNLRVVDVLGSFRVLTWTLALNVVACVGVAVATHAEGASVWWVIVPLFFAISVAGPLLPNATTLALEGQSHAIGAASACIGLLQTIFGAFIPPTVSLLGVTPQLMGTSMAIAAVLCFVPLLAVPRLARS